jgi:hypothetical protein
MYAYRTQLTTNGRQLKLDLPPGFPTGRVEVVVTVAEDLPEPAPEARAQEIASRIAENRNARENSDHRVASAHNKCRPPDEAPLSDAFFAWLDNHPAATGRTRAEIDAEIAEERNAWGED